jgi:inner membrane protein
MDPVTHTLTGFALSRAGLNKWTSYSVPILLLAANAPDIDLVAGAWGRPSYLEHHRTFTHSVMAMPILAALTVLVVRLFARRKFSYKWAWLAAMTGVSSHLALDWLNEYGVQLFLPFSHRWWRLDCANLVDIWIWAALAFAAAAPLFSRLVSSEIGAKQNPNSGRAAAVLALCFVGLYAYGRTVLHDRAVAVLDSRTYRGAAPTSVAALPDEANPFTWHGVIETNSFYELADVNLLGAFDPDDGRVFYRPQPSPEEFTAERLARKTDAFHQLLRFAQYPFWRFTPVDKGIRVEVMDLRFGAPPHPRFLASAIVTMDGRIMNPDFNYDPPADGAAAR